MKIKNSTLKTTLLALAFSAAALFTACGEEQAFPEGPEHLRAYIDGTQQYLVLQEPEHEFFAVEDVLADEKTGGYAVIYIVSDISDEVNPSFGSITDETSHLEVQFFDKNGEYLNLLHTDLESHTNDDENFYDGMLSFNTSGFERHGRVIYDSKNDEYVVLKNTPQTSVRAIYFYGDVTLVVNDEYDSERSIQQYTVVRYDRAVQTASATFETDDMNFVSEAFSYDAENAPEFSAKDNTVIFASKKISFYIDLNTGAHTQERHYTDDMLETHIATNPEGDIDLYLADSGGAGDAMWADIVVRDVASGEITFLGTGGFSRPFFGHKDHVFLSLGTKMHLFNYRTGELVDDNFGIFPTSARINAAAWDEENQCYVITYFGYDEETFWSGEDQELHVAVIAPDGIVIKSSYTGQFVRIGHNGFIRLFTLELNGDGTANLIYNYEAEAVITYGELLLSNGTP